PPGAASPRFFPHSEPAARSLFHFVPFSRFAMRPLLPFIALGLILAACAPPPAAPSTPESPGDPAGSAAPVAAADSVVVSPVCPPVLVYSSTPRANYSLGYEHYKNLDYCAALPYLRWVVANDPLLTGTDPDDRNFRRLADI